MLIVVFAAYNYPYSLRPTPEAFPLPVMDSELVTDNIDHWQAFLRGLPTRPGNIVAYNGALIGDQGKHVAIIPFDVGQRDLQQCADAIIRLRAEYLYKHRQYDKIRFQFTSGHTFSWEDYCKGLLPRIRGSKLYFVATAPRSKTYASLRSYLDIVYTYAGTQSLYRELKPANEFAIGTIIVKPGSPGHCCIIIDEATRRDGTKLFKLAEGYMPAQSIYILKNRADGTPWHELKEGEPVLTASYHFKHYYLRQF